MQNWMNNMLQVKQNWILNDWYHINWYNDSIQHLSRRNYDKNKGVEKTAK
jgi:hypothetical protein